MAHERQTSFFLEPVERALGFAACCQAGDTLYLSGLVSIDEQQQVIGAGDMTAQINRIYDVMETILARSQASLEHVVKETIYTTDIAALGAAAGARVARFAHNAPPAATAVQVSGLFFPEAVIEIDAIAYIGR